MVPADLQKLAAARPARLGPLRSAAPLKPHALMLGLASLIAGGLRRGITQHAPHEVLGRPKRPNPSLSARSCVIRAPAKCARARVVARCAATGSIIAKVRDFLADSRGKSAKVRQC